MKVNTNNTKDPEIISMLINHFNYSIEDINSYDELTEKEKCIITKDVWNKLCE